MYADFTDDYIAVSSFSVKNPKLSCVPVGYNFSIEYWYRADELPLAICGSLYFGSIQIIMRWSSSGILFDAYISGSERYFTTAYRTPLLKWQHYVWVVNIPTVKLYVNGVLQETNSVGYTGPVSKHPGWVCAFSSPYNAGGGYYRMARVWNIELSEKQIKKLYREIKSYGNHPEVKAEWFFDANQFCRSPQGYTVNNVVGGPIQTFQEPKVRK